MKFIKNKKIINFNNIYIFIIVLLAILRILLMMGMPLWGIADSVYDDALMLKLAKNILNGQWLGIYDNNTLVKGVSYPLFLALCSYLNIPYLMALASLYTFSVLIFIIVIKDIIKSKKCIILIYAFILFSPAMFEVGYVQRVYRMSIIPSQVLLIISCFSAMYIRRKDDIKIIIPWALGAGISLSFFWFTREDSIWIIPFIIGSTFISFIAIIVLYKNNKKILLKKFLVYTVPIIILMCSITGIKFINYKYYGIYETNDLKNTYFSDVISKIYSIKPDEEQKGIWVTRSTVKKLYEVSPAFRSIKDEMESSLDIWSKHGANPDDNEVEKDYFMWALRLAVVNAGYYKNASETNQFYKYINDEIEQAFNRGLLENEQGFNISSLSRPFKKQYIKPLIKCWIETVKWIACYEKINITLNESTGENEYLREIEAITNNHLIYPTSKYFRCKGWMFATNNQDNLKSEIIDENGNIEYIFNFSESKDVNDDFLSRGEVYENSKKCRFSTQLSNISSKKLFLNIYINNKLIDKIDLSKRQNSYENEKYKLYFDESNIGVKSDPYKVKAEKNIDVSKSIINIYKYTGDVLLFLGVMSYIMITIKVFIHFKEKKYLYLDTWFILTGVLFSFIILVTGVSYNYYEAWNSNGRNLYLAGSYPLMQMFISISLFTTCLNFRNNK